MAAVDAYEIGRFIFHVLKNDSTLLGYLDNGALSIQPVYIDGGALKNGIVYTLLNVDNENTKTTSRANLTRVVFRLEVFSDTFGNLQTISRRIGALLDKPAQGEYNGVDLQSCIIETYDDDFDEKNKLYYRDYRFNARIFKA
jgi:hypothetical protein